MKKIKLSENDQPYSEMWQNYTLEGLNGTSFYTESAGLEEAFAKRIVSCPKCRKRLTKQHFKR